ncbi:MAG: hypothetical protein ABIA04_08510 [Pseudomonadota bacterium]
MDKTEAKEEATRVSNLNKKLMQSLELRRKLLRKRISALNSLISLVRSKQISEESIKLALNSDGNKVLSFCNRNERRLMNVLKDSKKETLNILNSIDKRKLKEIRSELKKTYKETRFSKASKGSLVINPEALTLMINSIDIYQMWKEVVVKFYDNYALIENRLNLESSFLANPSSETLIPYLSSFKNELIEQKAVEKRIFKISRKGAKNMAGIAMIGAYVFSTTIGIISFGATDPYNIPYILIYGAILTGFFGGGAFYTVQPLLIHGITKDYSSFIRQIKSL